MSDENENETIESPALCRAYEAAVLARGREAADAVLRSHGATTKHWRSVPKSKQAAATNALEALAGQMTNSAADNQRGFDRLHATAFPKQAARPTPPKSLDEKAIWDRFNSPPPVERDQG